MNDELQYYEKAVQRLEYIEMVKRTICSLLQHLSDTARSDMTINACAHEQAEALIREAINEMYYEEASSALKTKEAYKEWGE